MNSRRCRFCETPLQHTFIDLGASPLSNSYLAPEQLRAMEPFYPLHAFVCEVCFLVQVDEVESPDSIFSDYAYFSSFSKSWLRHAERYAEMMVDRFGFGAESLVVEVASNDGYLLRYFKEHGVPVLGIEPAANVAKVAEEAGVPTRVTFFGVETARELLRECKQADLLVGNNVLAHVPALNDFVAALAMLLKPQGVLTMEFPHLVELMRNHQFDTIYHEHFSYFSLYTVERIFERHGLVLFDVEQLPTHGGSLRIFVKHREDASKPVAERLLHLRELERQAGIHRLETYQSFAQKVLETKRELVRFLLDASADGKRVVAYGAAAKGNTLLNYCGVRGDCLDYVVDLNPYKQGKYLPGTRIPIYPPDRVRETKPDYLLILPWNLKDEIMGQMAHVREWGGRFVVPIPRLEVLA